MEIRTEYHRTQKTLFRRVNQIRKANGTCDFEQEGNGYRLKYCETDDLDHVYIVQNGKDGLPFRLHDGMEGSFFHLSKGEILVYECESGNTVWFSYPKWLEKLGETDLDHHIGYTEYGSLSEMVQAGFILPARHADRLFVTANGEIKETLQKVIIPKQVSTEEAQAEVQSEALDKEPEIFMLLTGLMKSSDMKTALEKARQLTEYHNKHTGACIGTHRVMYRWYYCGYNFFDGCKYTQAAQMRFGGRWMEQAGFGCGQSFQVITIKNVILIVPLNQADN